MLKKPPTPIPFFLPGLTVTVGMILAIICPIASMSPTSASIEILIWIAVPLMILLLAGGGYLLGKRRQEIDRYYLWLLNIRINAKLRELDRPPIDIGQKLDELGAKDEEDINIDMYV